MGPGDLHRVLEALPTVDDPRLLVGAGTFDDAGVVRLTDEIALVQSVDFFTPVVDDPHDYGRIAAANALSDVYAMGAEPLTAMAVCAFPRDDLPLEVLQKILAGGLSVVREAGALVVGGHTVKGPELTYGLAVTGIAHPDHILTNAGAHPGDVLFLSKPIGTGILATALKRGHLADDAAEVRAMIDTMARLNRGAAHAAIAAPASALTDITGYGLLGHGLELAAASGVGLEIDASAVPLLPGALAAAHLGLKFGGLTSNKEWLSGRANLDDLDAPTGDLLADPQTSGGLLAAIPESAAAHFREACAAHGVLAVAIGRAVAEHPGEARVTGSVRG